jgi:hypothetical protein
MHSPLILPVARRSILSESSFVNLCSHRRPRYLSSGFNSRIPAPFFFQILSLDLSNHDSHYLKINHANHRFFPIFVLLWNPNKNWLVQRRDSVAKNGDRGVEGRKGWRARHEGRRLQAPLGRKLSSPMDGDVDLEEAHISGKKECPVCLPSHTSGIQEKWITRRAAGLSGKFQISESSQLIILAMPHRITTA